jgi:CubicO group peptidase (beta-lactamase class C family)
MGASGAGATGGTGGTAGAGTGGSEPEGLVDFLGASAFPDSFWESAELDEMGMASAPIEQALLEIASSDWEIHSFLVARRGKLVVEQYGWDSGTNEAIPGSPHQILPDERHPLFSTTKSFLSALIGVALDEGSVDSLEEAASSYFPDYANLNPSAEKDQITLEDLLTMRSGLEWTEGEQSTFEAPDPARAMFSREVVDTPVGDVWNYSSGGSDILSEILRVATGMTPLEYANEKLFGPLGIDSPPWEPGKSGTQHGGWGLSLTSREAARFGELYRNEGQWMGQQVVPMSWISESTAARCPTPWGGQYAYHFWVPDLPGFFSTLGAFGQVVYVSRERELVVVFTANMPSEPADTNLRRLISDYIVPSIVD